PAQCRAARGLLAWSQQELAQKAGVGVVTVHQLEAGTSKPRRATLEVIQQAFERAGVEFINENGGGPGLRLRRRQRKKAYRQAFTVRCSGPANLCLHASCPALAPARPFGGQVTSSKSDDSLDPRSQSGGAPFPSCRPMPRCAATATKPIGRSVPTATA